MNIQRLVGKRTRFFAAYHSRKLTLVQLKVIAASITHGIFIGRKQDVAGPVFWRPHEHHTHTNSQDRQNDSFHRSTSQWLIRREQGVPVSRTEEFGNCVTW